MTVADFCAPALPCAHPEPAISQDPVVGWYGDQPRSRRRFSSSSSRWGSAWFGGGYGGGGGGAYNAQSGTAAAPRPRRRAERLPLSGDGGGATSPRRRAKAMARFLVFGTSGWKRWGGPGDNGGGAWVFVGLLCWPGGPPFEGSGSGEAEDGGQRIPPHLFAPRVSWVSQVRSSLRLLITQTHSSLRLTHALSSAWGGVFGLGRLGLGRIGLSCLGLPSFGLTNVVPCTCV